MNRRHFIKQAVGVGVISVVVAMGWLKASLPVRYTRALRKGRFRGSIKSLNKNDLCREGKWGG